MKRRRRNIRILTRAALLAWMGAAATGCAGDTEPVEPAGRTRNPAVAGAFYPDNPETLRETVSKWLAQAPARKGEGEVVAAVAPHAGYVFSGRIAAAAFKALRGLEVDTMVIIGHDCGGSDTVAYVSDAAAFETPLGRVRVDAQMATALRAAHPGIRTAPRLHAREHTVEVQLPFLQVLGLDCAVVPVLFGRPTLDNSRVLANAIREAAGARRVFVLASSDLSHYPPAEDARELDRETLEAVRSLDPEALFSSLSRREQAASVPNLQTLMCARGGVAAALYFARARGADRAEIVASGNSGDVPGGGTDRVVGYGSVLLTRTGDRP